MYLDLQLKLRCLPNKGLRVAKQALNKSRVQTEHDEQQNRNNNKQQSSEALHSNYSLEPGNFMMNTHWLKTFESPNWILPFFNFKILAHLSLLFFFLILFRTSSWRFLALNLVVTVCKSCVWFWKKKMKKKKEGEVRRFSL